MPALPNVSKVLKVALSGTFSSGQVWLSRFYIGYTGTAPLVADLVTFNTAVATAYGADLKTLLPPVNVLTQIETIDLTSPTSAVAIDTVSVAGTRSGSPVPAQVCLVSSYEIARRYRGGHPRGYWPWGVQTDIASAGSWATAFTSACTTGLNSFFTALVAAGWSGAGTLSQKNVSYYSGFTVVTNPVTGRARNVPTLRVTPLQDPVTSIVSRISYGTQRRREAFID